MTSDPTELSGANDSLAEARRRTEALAFFARRMAHDLSNFLTVIRTYSELLLAELPQDHTGRADLEEIAQAADTTVAYVQRTSAFGRAASSKVALVDIDALVADVVQQADQKGLGRFAVSTGSGAQVSMSAPGLADAVHELLVNAREASPEGAVVTVRTHTTTRAEPGVDAGVPIAAGSWCVVEIEDEGEGLRPTIAENAFDPFVTSKAGVRGAGFGLTTARATAWAAGGQVTLGRNDGKTVARIYLPVGA